MFRRNTANHLRDHTASKPEDDTQDVDVGRLVGNVSTCTKHRRLQNIKSRHNQEFRRSESSGRYCRVVKYMSTDASDGRSASIISALMREAARTSVTSGDT
jgi:hypothetical protein